MSMNRICECGKQEDIRFNFGDNYEAEAEFHAQKFTCLECKENEEWIKRLEDMDLGDMIETLDSAINKLKDKNKNK